MVQYRISKQDLIDKITAEKSDWFDETRLRVDAFAEEGRYDEDLRIPDLRRGGTKKASAIWSDIKPVYMRLQSNKCAYCERLLPSEDFGRGEHDLEHYRPKKKASPWKVPESLSGEGVVVTPPLSGNSDPGYHLLAYHPLNYCASCRTCNSSLKGNEFPIEGTRDAQMDDPESGNATEKPLLLFPIGEIDEDPQAYIGFHGLSPYAIPETGFKRRRALVTIEFFKLGDPNHKILFIERAELVVAIYHILLLQKQHGVVLDDDILVRCQSPSSKHSSCAASFIQLFDRDEDSANQIYDLANAYLNSVST